MFWFYLLAKLDDFVTTCGVVGIGGLIGCAFLLIPILTNAEANSSYHENSFLEIAKRYLKEFYWWKLFWISITSLIIGAILPSTKQAAFIWVAPQIVENGAVKDTVKNIPELTKLGTEYLKQLLEEKTK